MNWDVGRVSAQRVTRHSGCSSAMSGYALRANPTYATYGFWSAGLACTTVASALASCTGKPFKWFRAWFS